MRSMITIVRFPSLDTVHSAGANARRVLAGIEGVSDVRIQSEEIDRATLSYQWADSGSHFVRMDETLRLQGMRRVR